MSKTMNYIMPPGINNGMCKREDKNKVHHRWIPSGQTRALPARHVGIECLCKHCGEREWGTVSQIEFIALSEAWEELS